MKIAVKTTTFQKNLHGIQTDYENLTAEKMPHCTQSDSAKMTS